jgi:hypothetical protein
VPDDVKALTLAVLAHRLISKRWTQGMRDDTARRALAEILEKTIVPA